MKIGYRLSGLIFIFLFMSCIKLYALDIGKLWKEPVYKSSGVIEIFPPASETISLNDTELNHLISRKIGSAVVRMKRCSQVEDIIKELNLEKAVTNEVEYRNLVERIRRGIDIKKIAPNFLEISCVYTNPLICKKIVNLLMRKLIINNLQSQEKKSEDRIESLNQQIEVYRKNLQFPEIDSINLKKIIGKYSLLFVGLGRILKQNLYQSHLPWRSNTIVTLNNY